MLSISVRGLPRQMTEKDLTDLFEPTAVCMAEDGRAILFSGECKACRTLQMESPARAAIAALNGSTQAAR